MILSTILWILFNILFFSMLIHEILKYCRKDKVEYDVVYKVSPLFFALCFYLSIGTIIALIGGLIMSFIDITSYIILIILSIFCFYPLFLFRLCNYKVAIKDEDIFIRNFSQNIHIKASDIKYIKKGFFNTYIMYDEHFKKLFSVRTKNEAGVFLYECILMKSNPISVSLGVNTFYYENNNSNKEFSKEFLTERKKIKKERYIVYLILISAAIFCFITFLQEGFVFPMIFFPCLFLTIIIIIEIIFQNKEKKFKRTTDFQFRFSRRINNLIKIKNNFIVIIFIGIYFLLVSIPVITTSNYVNQIDYNHLNKIDSVVSYVIKNEYGDVIITATDGKMYSFAGDYLEYINNDLLLYIKENDKIWVLAEKNSNYSIDGTIEYDCHYLKVNDKVLFGKLQLDNYVHDQKVAGSRTSYIAFLTDIVIISLMILSYKRYKKSLSKELNNSNEKVNKITIKLIK